MLTLRGHKNTGLRTAVVTAPVGLVVTLQLVKDWIKANYGTSASEDAVLTSLIKAATTRIEKFLGRSLLEQTRHVWLETHADNFRIPYGPVREITAAKKWNSGESEPLVEGTDYFLSPAISAEAPRDTEINFNQVFRVSTGYGAHSLELTYDAGYVTVPEDIIHGVKLQVAHDWVTRGDKMQMANIMPLTALVKSYIRGYKTTRKWG